jgi:hypothetical protein
LPYFEIRLRQIKQPCSGRRTFATMAEIRLQESELVPLSVAASLAYFELTGVKGQAGSEEHLRDVIDLAVVALSHAAPIHRRNADGDSSPSVMSATQVEQLLFIPIREGREAPDLEPFYIRRSDLHAVITSFRKNL